MGLKGQIHSKLDYIGPYISKNGPRPAKLILVSGWVVSCLVVFVLKKCGSGSLTALCSCWADLFLVLGHSDPQLSLVAGELT